MAFQNQMYKADNIEEVYSRCFQLTSIESSALKQVGRTVFPSLREKVLSVSHL